VTQPKKENLFYYPYLDGLRFFALLMVFISHSPVLWPTPFWMALHDYGWMGVDLFLCLSAFLFTKLLFLEYQATGDINVKNFYIRRALRIWPLYYFFIGAMLVLTLNEKGWNVILFQRTLGLATFTDNILSAFLSYNSILIASAHLWTISYEEQFYAVIPWFLRKIFKMNDKAKLLIISSIFLTFIITRVVMIFYFQVRHPAIWVLPITHFESILGGLIVGLGLFDNYLKKIPGWLLMLIGIAILVMTYWLPNGNVISWNLFPLYFFVGLGMSLILYSLVKEEEWAIKRLLENKFLMYFGKISYGLYVYHVFGLKYWQQVALTLKIPLKSPVSPLSVFVWGLCFTLLMSVISYQWLEKPFLRFKEKFSSIQSRPI
jgi:peptidoglycan/LPS O-acetylase OafA/YrhL